MKKKAPDSVDGKQGCGFVSVAADRRLFSGDCESKPIRSRFNKLHWFVDWEKE